MATAGPPCQQSPSRESLVWSPHITPSNQPGFAFTLLFWPYPRFLQQQIFLQSILKTRSAEGEGSRLVRSLRINLRPTKSWPLGLMPWTLVRNDAEISTRWRDDGNNAPSRGQAKRQSERRNRGNDRELHLACPFYKSDRGKYQDCLKLQLKRIKDVKQHLNRKHMQPPYCPSCGLEFDTQERQMKHSRVQLCQIRDYPRPDGINHDQKETLSARADRNMS
ncbi:hypothetical protein CGGC5_v000507 [Colletotrichum fructicola Nara gc5]|uniref:C2H2-type domain-containing protein n=1 Tax=Colletotrichum fructicola (strain Nara gc5) TaxID=1213859 RepID=A0A7J6JLM4_COLFN|nr:hypothetical protein CGGC5_v000507 [Colletotrichum fructicola Nara gc5]KAF4904855.1 hypothetical protein CGCFRS4_v000941 [Colletotrichum fructicola]KAF4933440.1 hypothetical protein CGCF245_v009560 [Colletotrichum fructicola]